MYAASGPEALAHAVKESGEPVISFEAAGAWVDGQLVDEEPAQ